MQQQTDIHTYIHVHTGILCTENEFTECGVILLYPIPITHG